MGKHYQTVVAAELTNVSSMLADFDSLYAAAMVGEREGAEPESLDLVEEATSEPEDPDSVF